MGTQEESLKAQVATYRRQLEEAYLMIAKQNDKEMMYKEVLVGNMQREMEDEMQRLYDEAYEREQRLIPDQWRGECDMILVVANRLGIKINI